MDNSQGEIPANHQGRSVKGPTSHYDKNRLISQTASIQGRISISKEMEPLT